VNAIMRVEGYTYFQKTSGDIYLISYECRFKVFIFPVDSFIRAQSCTICFEDDQEGVHDGTIMYFAIEDGKTYSVVVKADTNRVFDDYA
jgi:hypothetical protein